MPNSPYSLMQRAVDTVGKSLHPTNKIAATLSGQTASGEDYVVSAPNLWPEPIRTKIGADVRIGNSSGTIHAETACILQAPMTRNAALFITDPPCPNCVKNIAEAGIKTLYIDHKGFEKDFAQRRGHEFNRMSLRICERAGISIFRVYRKEQRLETILEIPADYNPPLEKPSHVEPLNDEAQTFWIKAAQERYGDEPFALAYAADHTGARFVIMAEPHPVIGFTHDSLEVPEDKYSFILQPVNRVLMTARRRGIQIEDGTIYSSIVPTAREFVNITGAGMTSIRIGNLNASRDEYGPMALKQLVNAGILNIQQ